MCVRGAVSICRGSFHTGQRINSYRDNPLNEEEDERMARGIGSQD